MNNLVFNTTANQLKTAIYGEAPDTSLQAVKVDASQHLLAAVSGTVTIGGGTVTVSEVTNPITISNTSLTVAGTVTIGGGTVTVAEVTNPITISNTSLTVAGTVTIGGGTVTVAEVTNPITISNTSLTVAGTVTVAEVTNPITISNTSLTVTGTVTVSGATVTVGSNAFTAGTLAETSITGTGVLFADTDVSTVKEKSIFLYNGGTNTITLSLQFSPTTTDADYIDDPAYTDATIASGASLFIAATNFSHYMRIQYNMGATTETISGYYNLQA